MKKSLIYQEFLTPESLTSSLRSFESKETKSVKFMRITCTFPYFWLLMTNMNIFQELLHSVGMFLMVDALNFDKKNQV